MIFLNDFSGRPECVLDEQGVGNTSQFTYAQVVRFVDNLRQISAIPTTLDFDTSVRTGGLLTRPLTVVELDLLIP